MPQNKKDKILTLIVLIFGAIALISCSSAKFGTLQEADQYLIRENTAPHGTVSYFVGTPSVRKNETAANVALKWSGLIEDNKPLPVSPKELSTPSMYGEGGHKAPFWDITTRITFNRKVALIRTEPGKQSVNIIEAAVGRVGQPPKVTGCLIEKIQVLPHWPSDEYKGPDGSILIASGVSVRLLFSADQNSHTVCDWEAGQAYVDYMKKISESIKADLDEQNSGTIPFL